MTDTDSQQPLSNAQLNALRNRLGLHGRRYIRSAAKDLANETEQDSAAAVSPPEPLENLVEVTEIVEPEVDLDAIDFSDQLGL